MVLVAISHDSGNRQRKSQGIGPAAADGGGRLLDPAKEGHYIRGRTAPLPRPYLFDERVRRLAVVVLDADALRTCKGVLSQALWEPAL